MRMSRRKKRGSSIAESAAALSLLLPLAFLIIFAVMEGSHAFLIKNSLAQAARQAARDMSMAYSQDPAIEYDRTMQDSQVYDNIRIGSVVADSAQFDDAVFDTVADPQTVTVVVSYAGGQYGLPNFPMFDPLGWGSSINMSASSTYRL